MKNKFFKKKIDFEDYITEEGLIPEVYNHLNAIVKLDTYGNVISNNQVFLKQFGYTSQDFNKPFFDILLKDNAFENSKFIEKAFSGESQKFSAIGYLKNGDKIEIEITLIPYKYKSTLEIYAIIKNNKEFENQNQELNVFKKMQQAFSAMTFICSFHYDAINDYHHFSKQITDLIKIKPDNPFTPSLNHFLNYVHPEDMERVKNTVKSALKERVGFDIEYRIIRQDQTIRTIYEHAEIMLDKNGKLDGLVGFIQDITEQRNSFDVLEKENQIKVLYKNKTLGIWSYVPEKSEFLVCSKGIEHITGYLEKDFKNGLKWHSLVHKEDLPQYLANQKALTEGDIIQHQYRILNSNGKIKWVQDYTVSTLDKNGNIVRYDGLISDITEQKELEEKIKYMANYDVLTKLPNRHKFIEKLEELIDEYDSTNTQFAVIKLDINGFKYINDTVGNELGDELLKYISQRINSNLNSNDMLARRDGDLFMLLIDKINPVRSVETIIHTINNCLNKPFNIKEYQLYVTASFGICTYPENGVTSLELLRNASLALQNAKRGNNNYHILSHTNSIQSFKNYSIGRDIKKAVECREMVLYYQPRVHAITNQIIGAEALIRWNHPEWGLISPKEFITIAEENGLVTEIDEWVISEVCRQIKNWKDRHLHVVPISINISAIHFMNPDWPSAVSKIIRKFGIQPQDIEFEITENMILHNSDIVKNTIFKLKELGISIALDDFGKGYSSLSYLTQYPIDVIKIDKTFIRNMHFSERDLHLTKSIINMAKGLQLRVVAEGVETIRQLKTLRQEQCLEIQGYLYSQPVPINEFETKLQKKLLPPIDPKEKEKQSKRKHYRLNLPDPLEADIILASIANRTMQLGVSKVLVEDISVGGLRFVSTLKLPIRGDVIYQFKTEMLGKSITLNGVIIWKEEINEDLMEYGIKFTIEEKERAAISTLLNSFMILLKNNSSLPPYRKVTMNRDQYFM